MKVGDSVKVKKGIMSPDEDNLLIEGWQGRITEIDDKYITFELDSITLDSLTSEYIMGSLDEGLDYASICLEMNEMELTEPRDTQEDTKKKQNYLASKYNSVDLQRERISEILDTDDIDVDMDNQDIYFNYLKKNITKPCQLTGSDVFKWEEPFVFGDWSKKEYANLKLTKASYTDDFEMLTFQEEISDFRGIYVVVRRISDKKKFKLALWDLEVVDEKSPNYLLVSDYSSWMTNY